MRIILAISDLSMGGAERNVVNFAAALRDRGHDVSVLAGGGVLTHALTSAGILRIPSRTHLRRPWTVLRSARRIRRAHQLSPIDAVHAFMASTAVAAGIARKLAHAPGEPPFGIVSAAPSFSQDPGEARWLSMLRLRLLAASAEVVLAPSAALRAALLRAGAAESRVRLAEFNTVPVKRFADLPDPAPCAAELGIRPEHQVVCSVARLHPLKGQDQLLRAAPKVLASQPSARFVLVGDGPSRRALEGLAHDLGIDHAVRFAGEQEDVRPFLALASLVVQTTTAHGRAFGLGGPGIAVLEAWAAGRPVVGFEFPDLEAAVGSTGAALLVRHGDPDALAEGILTVLARPDRSRAIAEAGSRLVRERFDLERFAVVLEALYIEAKARADR